MKTFKMFHPVHTYKMKHIKHFEAIDLHHSIFENGKLVYQLLSEKEAQEYSKMHYLNYGMKINVI